MANEHTPGPYTLQQGFTQLGINDRLRVVSGPSGECIAFVNIWNDAEAEGEANAHLFKAAPKLLTALQGCIPWLESMPLPPANQDYRDEAAKALEAAFTAVAAATVPVPPAQ